MKHKSRPPDFREFLFTATGKDTALDQLDALDVHDNLLAELDRLHGLAELLSAARPDDIDPHALEGTALLLTDLHRRMRTILDLSIRPKPRKAQRPT